MAKSRNSKKFSTSVESTQVEVAAEEVSGVVMSGSEVSDPGTDALDALISDLEAAAPVVEAVAIETPVHSDADVAAAVFAAESVEASIAAATPEGVVEGGALPTVKGEKPAKLPRKFYTDKTERLKDRVGPGLSEFTVLTFDDAAGDDTAIAHRMEETLAIIKGMNKKEQARAGFLIEFVSGKKAKLNEVLERTLRVLHRDGAITTGKDGNVIKNLIEKPYSIASARAMSGNTISMYADLKLIVPDGKGKFVANPESLLLAKVNSMLFPAPAAGAAA